MPNCFKGLCCWRKPKVNDSADFEEPRRATIPPVEIMSPEILEDPAEKAMPPNSTFINPSTAVDVGDLDQSPFCPPLSSTHLDNHGRRKDGGDNNSLSSTFWNDMAVMEKRARAVSWRDLENVESWVEEENDKEDREHESFHRRNAVRDRSGLSARRRHTSLSAYESALSRSTPSMAVSTIGTAVSMQPLIGNSGPVQDVSDSLSCSFLPRSISIAMDHPLPNARNTHVPVLNIDAALADAPELADMLSAKEKCRKDKEKRQCAVMQRSSSLVSAVSSSFSIATHSVQAPVSSASLLALTGPDSEIFHMSMGDNNDTDSEKANEGAVSLIKITSISSPDYIRHDPIVYKLNESTIDAPPTEAPPPPPYEQEVLDNSALMGQLAAEMAAVDQETEKREEEEQQRKQKDKSLNEDLKLAARIQQEQDSIENFLSREIEKRQARKAAENAEREREAVSASLSARARRMTVAIEPRPVSSQLTIDQSGVWFNACKHY